MKRVPLFIVALTASLVLLAALGPQHTASAAPTQRDLTDSTAPQSAGSTRVVTSAADAGPGTFRQALLEAQHGDTITFDPAIFPPDAPTAIMITTPLPELHQGAITVDASGAGVILDGSQSELDALTIISDGNVILGLQIRNFPNSGIWIGGGASDNVIGGRNATPGGACTGDCNVISGNGGGVHIAGLGTSNNTVIGNYIGTDASGTSALPNWGAGVGIVEGAQHNRIGGAQPGERNLISGNGEDGIMIEGDGTAYNKVIGNYIGTNAMGTKAIPNGNMGVNLSDHAQYNQVGGETASERNLISGNRNIGVHIAGTGVMHNVVTGNYIGTDATGTRAIGNLVHGVAFGSNAVDNGAEYNRVGGETPGAGNLISGNGDGIRMDSPGTMHNTITGNTIGTDAGGTQPLGNDGYGVIIYEDVGPNTIGPGNSIAYNRLAGVGIQGDKTLGNTITGNAIHHNGTEGIENSQGGNAELPAPDITYIDARVVEGTALPNATVEVFSGEANQGAIFEGSTIADASGAFTFRMPAGRFTGPHVMLTATDAAGNTSQFSAPQIPPAPAVTKELPGIVAPQQVSTAPAVVGTNLGLALFCVAFFGFTSNVFNAILEDYRDEIAAALEKYTPESLASAFKKIDCALQGLTARGRGRLLLMWLIVLLMASAIESFLDPEVALLSPERLGLLVTIFISAVIVSALEAGSDLYAHRRWAPETKVESKVQWIGMVMAVICVLVSRALAFKPGYMYGIVGTLYLIPDIDGAAQSGKRALCVLLTIFAGGAALWLASAFLPPALLELEPIFLTVFLLALQGVFFQLLPLTLTDGGDLWGWKKGAWFAFFVIVAFCFYHFLLNPNASEVQALQQNGVQTVLLLIAIFGLATLALWLRFPYRLERQKAGEN